MDYLEEISKTFNIDTIYIILLLKSLLIIFLSRIIKRIGTSLFKKTLNNKQEYIYNQKYLLVIDIITFTIIIFIWGKYITTFLTLISLISAAFTIALRDLIFNFFCGIYIKIKKPFELEDRIEINDHKGDVINIKSLNFELLELRNDDLSGQSTGIIIHIPNSSIFNYYLRNYTKAFKYIWYELIIKIPLDADISKSKSVIYKIVNSNEIIKAIPPKMKNQINNSSNNYRIYYNQYDPIIYTKVVDSHIELQVRYLVHPKKARYVESTIWNNILTAYKNKEIELYKD